MTLHPVRPPAPSVRQQARVGTLALVEWTFGEDRSGELLAELAALAGEDDDVAELVALTRAIGALKQSRSDAAADLDRSAVWTSVLELLSDDVAEPGR